MMNHSLRDFLISKNFSDYTNIVPRHWLDQEAPNPKIQLGVSVALLCACIPANLSQLLVFAAYLR